MESQMANEMKSAGLGAASGNVAAFGTQLGNHARPPHEHGMFDSRGVLTMLYRKALPRLNRADMEWLRDGAESLALTLALQASACSNGIACLVNADGGDAAPVAGNFQSKRDVADLLFLLANQFDHIAGLIEVGSEAEAAFSEGGTR
jgi:hypothetical protein